MKTLWYGGTIYTMEKENDTVDAVLVEDGIIQATGTFDHLRNQAKEFIDLKGAVMFPGFNDSHLHIIGYGEKLKNIDATNMGSKRQLLQTLHEHAKKLSKDDWLVAIGMNENSFVESCFPTLQELDEINCHVVIKRTCHHLIVANTKALEYAGITNDTPSPVGGIIEKINGQLTGVLKDAALYLIVNHMPTISKRYVYESLEKAIDSLLQYGIVGGTTEDLSYYNHFSLPLNAFQALVEKRQNFKVHLLVHHTVFEEVQQYNNLPNSTWLELGAMKIFIDGALGGRTAALLEPYNDDTENKGIFIQTEEQLDGLVKIARKYNQTVAVHVIGDAALDLILNVLEKNPPNKKKQFDRLIHCSLVNENLLNRLRNAQIAIDFQPQFIQSNPDFIKSRLGEERLNYVHPLKSFLNRGILVAGGSDAPIETPNPLHGIYAAVTRKNIHEIGEGQQPWERCTLFEAISLYTTGAAKIIGKSHIRGKIAPKYEADFTIFAKDLFKLNIEELPNVKVKYTVVQGNIVYKA